MLPPSQPKSHNYSGSAEDIDLYQLHRAIAVGLTIVNTDSTNSVTFALDDGNTITLLAGVGVSLPPTQFTKIALAGTGTADLLFHIIPETLYNRAVAKLARVD